MKKEEGLRFRFTENGLEFGCEGKSMINAKNFLDNIQKTIEENSVWTNDKIELELLEVDLEAIDKWIAIVKTENDPVSLNFLQKRRIEVLRDIEHLKCIITLEKETEMLRSQGLIPGQTVILGNKRHGRNLDLVVEELKELAEEKGYILVDVYKGYKKILDKYKY